MRPRDRTKYVRVARVSSLRIETMMMLGRWTNSEIIICIYQ